MATTSSKITESKTAVIATEHPLASSVGLDVLTRGGNAFDAAVATGFTLSVVQPHLSGLGGDFFALVHHARSGRVYCLNSSGWSSSSTSVEGMVSLGYGSMPRFGKSSVVVPGFVKGMHAMHKKFGSLDLQELLEPAVGYAKNGFPILRGLSGAVRANLGEFTEKAREVMAPGGRVPRAGEVLKQEAMGATIEKIAEGGPDEFYRGEVSEEICAELSDDAVAPKLDDLASFEPEWVAPLKMPYRGSIIYEVPPNSMGATTLLILKELEGHDMKAGANSVERIETTLGAVEEAYRRRDEELGDPRFVNFDLSSFLRPMKKKEEEEGRSASGALRGARRGTTKTRNADTTYFTVCDGEGNILSCIQSVFYHFGSKVFVSGGGFFLNNRGSSFRFSGPNKLEPRKRPLHTLSSLLIEGEDGEPRVALGCSGGEFRPQQHTLLVTNMLDYSMPLADAINFPRFLWESGRSPVMVERGYKGVAGLTRRATEIPVSRRTGVAQGAIVRDGEKEAACDIRGEGVPLGL